jgi:hypothetical protein
MAFCSDCVLATDEKDATECNIPPHFYDVDDYFQTFKP